MKMSKNAGVWAVTILMAGASVSFGSGNLSYWAADWDHGDGPELDGDTGMIGLSGDWGDTAGFFGLGIAGGQFSVDRETDGFRGQGYLRAGHSFFNPYLGGYIGYKVNGYDIDGAGNILHGPMAGLIGRIPLQDLLEFGQSIEPGVIAPPSSDWSFALFYDLFYSPFVMQEPTGDTTVEGDTGTGFAFEFGVEVRHRDLFLRGGYRHEKIRGVAIAVDEELSGMMLRIGWGK